MMERGLERLELLSKACLFRNAQGPAFAALAELKELFSMQTNFFARKFCCPSTSLAPVLLPSPRETHFWYILPDEVHNESLLKQYMTVLSPCERDYVISIKEDDLKKKAILARVLVRTTLARYTGYQVSPQSLKFRKNIFGKPEVLWQLDKKWNPPLLHFNMSHTSSLIACGVTTNAQIGIDVEEKQRKIKHNIAAFARRYFSPQEAEFLNTFSDPERQRKEFLKLWTLKEAYVKALGRGFSAAPFKTFNLQLKTDGGKKIQATSLSDAEVVLETLDDQHDLSTNWQFALFQLAGSHYAAICVEKETNIESKETDLLRLQAWKTVPFVEDEYVSGTNAVIPFSGISGD
ncbi:hypothetical protein H6P81_000339 [Aristolochia fimbriata]|uniref:holo-[acyl-carrier-protein] synthase n=1 Tax=Aristolochia fimbriata TaxID=158543 RepID=A0AAV7F6U9_ARIFI|nr:hypothetical protein H6P81_000339 [Aristolochia fimbriata]